MLWEFLETEDWSIVFDENQMSGKTWQTEGHGKLDNSKSEMRFYLLTVQQIQEFWLWFGKDDSEAEDSDWKDKTTSKDFLTGVNAKPS